MPRPIVSDAAERLYARMAAHADGDEDGGWILLHLCEARTRMSAKAQQALRHDDTGSGRRRMHDPQRAPDWYLPRLRDLVGNDDQGLTGAALRTSILERPRARRCTRSALISAVTATLTGPDPTVRIVERADGQPFLMYVITSPAETPDPAETLRAARRHKPLFVRLVHVLSAEPLIDEGTLTIDAVTATIDAATVADVT